jgi:hypothetical protein
MCRKWKQILIILLVPLTGAIMAYYILESPSRVLRYALHLQRLPASIRNLRMGSDVWTDEVRCFYFEIAASDFPALLTGRDFRSFDMPWTLEARTIHIAPPLSIPSQWEYLWEVEGAHCEINTNAEMNRAIVVFSAH